MTSQKAQIQTLISEIDEVLGKASPRLPWVMSGDTARQRQVLKQIRNYLVSQQQQPSLEDNSGFESAGGGLTPYETSSSPQSFQSAQDISAETAQQVLKSVLEEMNYLRANVMHPLRSDLDILKQQRDQLVEEIRELETQRQQYALPQSRFEQLTPEFFQSLMARLQENLTGQVAQMLASMEDQPGSDRALMGASLEEGGWSNRPLLSPSQRLEQLQMLQSESDQIVLKLDATLRAVFESLQNTLKSYQESMGQGLDRMHNLGQQGEAMFAALINRLAEELGRGASTYLQSSLQGPEWQTILGRAERPTLTGGDEVSGEAVVLNPDLAQSSPASGVDNVTDAEIDRLLSELNAIAPSPSEPQPDVTDTLAPVESDRSGYPDFDASLGTASLNLLNLDLDQVAADDDPDMDYPTSPEDDISLFQTQDDDDITLPYFDEDVTLIQGYSDASPTGIEAGALSSQGFTSTPTPAIDNLDSALDLLNQLSAELHQEPEPGTSEPGSAAVELSVAPPRTEEEPPEGVALAESPESVYSEIDELYNTLFGPGGEAIAPSTSAEGLGSPLVQPSSETDATDPDASVEPSQWGDVLDEASARAEAFLNEDRDFPLPDRPLIQEEAASYPGASEAAVEATPWDETLSIAGAKADRFLSEASDVPIAPMAVEAPANSDALGTELLLPADTFDDSEDIGEPEFEPGQAPFPEEDLDDWQDFGQFPDSLDVDRSPVEAAQPSYPDDATLTAPEGDTIAALSDLLDQMQDNAPDQLSMFPLVDTDPTGDLSADLSEETFIPASPEEDLIGSDDASSEPSLDIPLDAETLQQLSADLEGLETDNLASLEANLESVEPPDWTLENWTISEPQAVSPTPGLDQEIGLFDELDEVDEVDELDASTPSLFASEPSGVEPLEAIAPPSLEENSDLADEVESSPPEALDDLFFPNTSDLSDLISDQGPDIASEPQLDDGEDSTATPPLESESTLENLFDQPTDESLQESTLENLFDQPIDQPEEQSPQIETGLEAGFDSEVGVDDQFLVQQLGSSLTAPTEDALSSDDFLGEQPDLTFQPDDLAEEFSPPDATPYAAAGQETSLEDLFSFAEIELPSSATQEQQEFGTGDLPSTEPPPSTEYEATLEELFAIQEETQAFETSLPPAEETMGSELPSSIFDDSSLESLFGTAESTFPEVSQPAGETSNDLFAESQDTALTEPSVPPDEVTPSPSDTAPNEEFNAFTLEGLDSLFEGLPDTGVTSPVELGGSEASQPSDLGIITQDLNLDNAFLGFADEETSLEASSEEDLTETDLEGPEKKTLNLETELPEAVLNGVEPIAGLESELETAPEPDLEMWSDRNSPLEDQLDDQDDDLISGIASFESDLSQDSDLYLTGVPPFQLQPPESPEEKIWYLGIDFGTTGISAVLLNTSTCELYPIYWSETRHREDEPSEFVLEKSFRLPTVAYLSRAGDDYRLDPNIGSPQQDEVAVNSIAIGSLALDLHHHNPAEPEGTANPHRTHSTNLLLQDFKPYLTVGIPHYSPRTSDWEPVLQWSDQHIVELSWLHQTLQTLLATLNRVATSPSTSLACSAVGLDAASFQKALRQLAGVIMGYPAKWPDTYCFNVREAVLGAKLVAHPEQIFFIEDAIATLLSGLRSADGRDVVLPNNLTQKPHLYNTDWQGSTLIISAGATVTELALVDIPDALQNLTYRDFTIRTLPYAGDFLDQDVICQLLYPTWARRPRTVAADAVSEPENWQGPMTEPMTWESLGLESLELPSPGEPDPMKRLQLKQRLERSRMGQHLLEAARTLKLVLQQQDRYHLELGDQQWSVMRRELGSRVLLPYIQRLNRELNALLTQTGVPIQAINQVICTGGTASFGAIARWLRQKLPNATIIQDTYANTRSGPSEHRLPTCSRVAYGLATLPLHPHVLDVTRQQYSDYFLLMEMLRAIPDQPLSVTNIMQVLEHHGINTQACHLHILAILEGHLPPGLIPTEKDAALLADVSRQNSDYQDLLSEPLFYKLDNQTYRPNPQQWSRFRNYLSTITASTHQKLSEPLILGLDLTIGER